ncbi:Ig-like domain-containing protein [Aeromicrobium sp.]|uniref:L,D-transpeptidase n=1 Tax=Aeromicrobium sp. TaxID=1871063 RepID=UPI003D6A22C4
MTSPHIVAVAAAALLLSSCSTSKVKQAVTPEDPITLSASVKEDAKGVTVDTIVTADAEHGTISKASLATSDGKTKIGGRLSGAQWVASERLEPGTAYTLTVKGTGDDGEEGAIKRTFTTQALTLQQQTYPAVAPLKGETVGIGMPVIVTFDLPVKKKALFERNMSINTDDDIDGSWSWISDSVVHYRPKDYWPAGTKVKVDLNLNGLPAGNGIYGQQDQKLSFKIGSSVVSTVDVRGHSLTVDINGKQVRRIPVSTGDAKHRTRQGTKIIMEKLPKVDMDAATTGVDSEDPDYYDIEDVKWAMRVTNSGEFLHAAPWSSRSHGRANVSHGCTGMSTKNASWLYQRSKRGDVVEFKNSPRGIEDQNGWTDWNVSWADWKSGSALSS